MMSPTCIKTWNSLLSALMVNSCEFMVNLFDETHLQAPFRDIHTYIHIFIVFLNEAFRHAPIYME